MNRPMTQERLHHLFNYNPKTGLLTWRVNRKGGAKAGDVAGTPHSEGYLRITIDGKLYYTHRLVWLYMTGEFPPDDVDHVNGNRSDNRIANLRLATRSQNNMNKPRPYISTSGIKGVSWDKGTSKWRAQIKIFRKNYSLGYFDTIEEAAAARQGAAALAFGEFIHDHDKKTGGAP